MLSKEHLIERLEETANKIKDGEFVASTDATYLYEAISLLNQSVALAPISKWLAKYMPPPGVTPLAQPTYDVSWAKTLQRIEKEIKEN